MVLTNCPLSSFAVCAGAAAARTANRNMKEQYKFLIEKRKRKHLQKVSRYKLAKVQYKRQLSEINKGLNRTWSVGQTKLNRAEAKMWRQNQSAMIKALQQSQYSKLLAGGRTGRSIKRIGTAEAAALGRFYASRNSALTDLKQDISFSNKRARDRANAMGRQAFAKVAFQPITALEPPRMRGQSVGWAMFGDIMSGINTAVGVANAIPSGGDKPTPPP